MSISENVAYLKGLAEGLDIDSSKKEGKLLIAIIDVLDEMATSIEEVEEVCDELDELVDIIDHDLGDLEEDYYELQDDSEEEIYEVTCPKCGDSVYLDENLMLDGEMDCPNCGQELEFDMSEISGCDDDCECDA